MSPGWFAKHLSGHEAKNKRVVEPSQTPSRRGHRREESQKVRKLGNGAMQDLSTASVVPCRQAVAMGRTLECTYYSVLYMPGISVLHVKYTTHRDIKIPNGQLWRGLGACPIRYWAQPGQGGQNGGAFNWLRSLASAEGGKSWEHWASELGKNGHGPSNLVHLATQGSQLLSTLARKHVFCKSSCCLNPDRDGCTYIVRRSENPRLGDGRTSAATAPFSAFACSPSRARGRIPATRICGRKPTADLPALDPATQQGSGPDARSTQSCVLFRRTPATRQPDQWPTSGREAAYILSTEYSVVQQQTPPSVDHLTCLVLSRRLRSGVNTTIQLIYYPLKSGMPSTDILLVYIVYDAVYKLRFSGLGRPGTWCSFIGPYPMQCLHEHLHRSNKIKNLK